MMGTGDLLEVRLVSLFMVDLVCTNKQNIQEINHQFSLMSGIYYHAESSIAWIGLQQKEISETAKYQDNTVAAIRFS